MVSHGNHSWILLIEAIKDLKLEIAVNGVNNSGTNTTQWHFGANATISKHLAV